MAIQIPNAGQGDGKTGDNEYVLWQKTINNFSDQRNAASRLVGLETSNLLEYGAFGLGSALDTQKMPAEFGFYSGGGITFADPVDMEADNSIRYGSMISMLRRGQVNTLAFGVGLITLTETVESSGKVVRHTKVYTDRNTTKDSNGFIKAASPIVRVFADKIECNQDASEQNIEYIKNGVGDYLIKNSSGLANDGWYIETPKDANGNVLVAVVYKQLENGDISIKTYAKRFDDETGDIVPNLARPRDIPQTRWIDLRLNDIEKEIPQIPLDNKVEE